MGRKDFLWRGALYAGESVTEGAFQLSDYTEGRVISIVHDGLKSG